MKIKEIRLKNYKSIKDSKFEASDFNVLIGKNNSGKSAVLDAIRNYQYIVSQRGLPISENVIYGKDNSNEVKLEFTLKLNQDEKSKLLESFEEDLSEFNELSVVKHTIKYNSIDGVSYQEFYLKNNSSFLMVQSDENTKNRRVKELNFGNFPDEKDYISVRKRDKLPFRKLIQEGFEKADYLKAFREAEDMRSVDYSTSLRNSGENLANTFHTIYSNEREKFEEIKNEFIDIMEGVEFVRSEMTPEKDATISIEEEIVENAFNLGEISSGSKQILILITKLVLSQDKRDFLLIEEPELHLHPEAQKQIFKLIRRISREKPQIFATTHSKEFIEESESSNVEKVDRDVSSEIHSVKEGEIEKEFQDLGYERGDLLQSNAVIFVEGKSDKLILKEFARELGHNLEEHGVSVIELEGKDNMKRDGRSLVKLLYSFNIPYLFLVDKDDHSSKREAEGEIVEAIKRDDDEGWWETEWDNFRSLEKYCIECYLIEKSAIAEELDETPTEIEEELDAHSDVEDKSKVLQNIYEEHLDLDYNKDRDGLKLAKRISEEDIDDEIEIIIDSVVEKSRN